MEGHFVINCQRQLSVVSNADCAHLTFGSVASGTRDASLTTKPLDSHGDVETVCDDDSMGQSDGRIHDVESKVTLAPPADEYAPPAAISNVENVHITSVQQSERANFLDVTSNTEYNLLSTPDYATSGPALQDSASQSYLQESQQFQNISPLSSFTQIRNGFLPPAIAPLRELDPALSPLFTNPPMITTVSTQPQGVSNADCAHLTFGSFASGTLDASLTTKPLDSQWDVATVCDDDSMGQSDGRIHDVESKVTLAPPADEYAPPAAISNVENVHITSVQQSERANFLDVTSNTEYNLSSTTDYATSGPALQDSASQSYLQESQQFQNISPLSSFTQIQNGFLPPAITPLRELDTALSPLFSNPPMITTVSTQPQGQYHDVNLDSMKKLVEELQLQNAELQQKLDAALAQFKEETKYFNPDPFIDEELKRCHDIFLCQSESGYIKLHEFLMDPQSKLTIDIKVHDGEDLRPFLQNEKDLTIYVPKGVIESRKKAKKLKRLTTVAKYILLGIIEDIYRLHRHGLSLNGKFTIESFYWTHLKKVKFDPTLKLVVCKRGRDEMINDYHQIYQILVMYFHDDDRPDDLQRLLRLLNSDDPVKYQDIIRYNMSLMSEIGKKTHFITLYDRLQQQISEDAKKGQEEKKSEKVLKYISKHFTDPVRGGEPWSCMACQNKFIEAIYEARRTNRGTKVLVEPLDLLIIWRNALTHVLDKSIKDGKPVFKDEDLVNMLELSIPGVFSELQRAMADVSLLELPHLMRALRM